NNNINEVVNGANILAAIGGNLNTNNLTLELLNNRGEIGTGGIVSLTVAGNITAHGDALFDIQNHGGTLDQITAIPVQAQNTSTHADILKAGVIGANGVLNIGGGTLSADTMLKLYAPGSNGELNFVSNVTLGGNSIKILAANSITIFDNVVVTIGGKAPADVYTNNANYTGFGGNGSTTGTFAGSGANRPQPLSKAPPFDAP